MSDDKREAWTRYYESTVSKREQKPRVVRSEKQAPVVLRGAEKQIAEDNAQLRRYRRAKAAEYKTVLAGPYGDLLKQVHDVLKQVTIEDGDILLEWLEKPEWEKVDPELRYLVMNLVDDTIMRLRVQNGLAPFDDSLPGEEPTVFELCRRKIGAK